MINVKPPSTGEPPPVGAHNLERMADRVTNICERTVFIATGRMMEFDQSDDETTTGPA
jgi:phosphate uptake regulator